MSKKNGYHRNHYAPSHQTHATLVPAVSESGASSQWQSKLYAYSPPVTPKFYDLIEDEEEENPISDVVLEAVQSFASAHPTDEACAD